MPRTPRARGAIKFRPAQVSKKYEKNPFKREARTIYTWRVASRVAGNTENTRNNNTHKGWAAALLKRGWRAPGFVAPNAPSADTQRGGCIVEIIASARRGGKQTTKERHARNGIFWPRHWPHWELLVSVNAFHFWVLSKEQGERNCLGKSVTACIVEF